MELVDGGIGGISILMPIHINDGGTVQCMCGMVGSGRGHVRVERSTCEMVELWLMVLITKEICC